MNKRAKTPKVLMKADTWHPQKPNSQPRPIAVTTVVLPRTRDMIMLATRKEIVRNTELSRMSLYFTMDTISRVFVGVERRMMVRDKMALMMVMDTCTSSKRSEQWLPLLKLHISCMVAWMTSLLKLHIICMDNDEIMAGCCWIGFLKEVKMHFKLIFALKGL